MVHPIFGLIVAGLTPVVIATLLRYGFWAFITYFVMSPVGDAVESYKISKQDEARRNKAADEAAQERADEIDNQGGDGNAYLTGYYDEVGIAKEEEKGSFLDEIARSLGFTRQTVLYILAGIIAFSLLKG